MSGRLLLSGFLAATLLWAGCGRRETVVAAGNRAQILHQGIGTEPQDLDPHLTQFNSHFNIGLALGEGLIGYDPRDLHPVPGVAERWEVSADGLSYTFFLRKNATWSNGDAVTADDFVFSARRILSPTLGSAYRYFYDDVRGAQAYSASDRTDFSGVGIRAIDSRTLRIDLAHPIPYLLFLLGHWSWYPVHRPTVEAAGPFDRAYTGWTKPGRMVTNGPFILAEWRSGQVIIVKKNPRYWNAGTVRLEEIRFYPVENAETEERMFRSGQLHITENIPANKLADYRQRPEFGLDVSPYFANYGYAFNVQRKPFDDVRVRRAFALAINRTKLVASQAGSGIIPATSVIPPGLDGYSYAGETTARFDPVEARRLLAEAGYPAGKGFPEVELSTNTGLRHQDFAEIVQQMWRRELGVAVRIANKEGKVFYDERLRGEFQICRVGWVGDYLEPSAFLTNYLTGSGQNQSRYASPEFDRLVATAMREPEPAARLSAYRAAEALLLRDVPATPVFWDTTHHLVNRAVRGRYPTFLDFHPYQQMWLEPVK